MTPTADLRTELCLLLGEATPPTGRFSVTELDYLLGKAGDVYEAAYLGWHLKSDKLIEEAGGGVLSITVGSESYKFSSLAEIEGYCDRKAKLYEKMSSTAAGSAPIIAHLEPSSIGLYELDEADSIETI